MAKIADFFADLKIKGDTLTLKDMVSKMSELRLSTIGEITGLGVLGDMMKNAGMHALDMATNYTTLTKELGINTDLLQRWQNVARASNVPAEAVASSFAHIQEVLAGIKHGHPDVGFMQGASFLGMGNIAGLSYTQILDQLRTAVPQSIRTQGRASTTDALRMMGIDPAMIQLLELNRRTFAARERTQGIMGPDDIRRWTDLNNQIVVLKQQFQILSTDVLEPLLPKLIAFGNAIEAIFGDKGPNARNHPILAGLHQLTNPATAKGAEEHFGKWARRQLTDVGRSILAGPPSIVQNNKVDIHAHGNNPKAIADEAKKAFDRHNQSQLNVAYQAGNSQEAR